MARPAVLRHDTLGAGIVSVGVVAMLVLSVVVGPRPAEEPAAPEPAPVEHPAPPSGESDGPGPTGPGLPEPRPTDPAGREDPADPEDPAPSGPAPARPVEPATPLMLRIGSIGITAPIVPVGLRPDGAMEIPDDVREVGWYDPDGLGVLPGATGTAVLASHVDSRSQGRGVLFELRTMRTGDTFELDVEGGGTQTWVVTRVAQIPKVSMPLNEIFTWAGPPRVVMITCGGEFDRSRGSYLDNIVVYAEPLGGSSAAPSRALGA